MKKLTTLCLIGTALLWLLTGCGAANATGSAEQAATKTVEFDSKQALSTENDTLHIQMLPNLLLTPDTGVTELLGEEDSKPVYGPDGALVSRTYTGTLFGQTVSFTVNLNEYGDVRDIVLTFPGDVSQAQLAASLTQQLDTQPAGMTWNAEGGILTLDGKTVTVEPYPIEE